MSDFALPKERLVDFLKKKRPDLHGKANELRKAVESWLTYIPATYPHFTEHTVNHSDEIIKQASNMLFENEGPTKPVLKHFSGSEAYLLIASAYLHDVGMVVSDADKVRVLESQEWKDWTTDGGGAKRHEEIQELREEKGTNEDVRHFRADVQMRYLLADFLRRTHHIQSAELVLPEQAAFARFGFDDPVAIHTISDICAGHGLHYLDLEDPKRFPDDKDVLGEAVNVRLIAILLRLGDLLDLRHDRACPLLMNAASPLPADSVAHWTQYQCFTDLTTRPSKVRIAAECRTLDEHRVIRDWCQWIVDEVHNARTLAARFERHKSWQPPDATIDGQSASISIERAAGANYFWSDWKFELDHAGVIERLIHDVYESPNDYIRELLQNAFDATRCKMYADLKASGNTPPEYPTQVEEAVREGYPIKITLEERQRTNEHTGETERRQYLVVEDIGIGMDREIIERYFLQISRSYYITPKFRREFGFVPASRFGVGFLSVFAVSDHIVVDTFKPSSDKPDRIRLTLTGPRNYLLTEESERNESGTRIEVELRTQLKCGNLTRLVENWCFRVEFPVFVNDLSRCTTVRAEKPADLIYDIPDIREEGSRFVRKSFPINVPGLEGEIYLETQESGEEGQWEIRTVNSQEYLKSHPSAHLPDSPGSVIAACGVQVRKTSGGICCGRFDCRGTTEQPTLSRTGMRGVFGMYYWWDHSERLTSRFCDILLEHLRNCAHKTPSKRWKYLQQIWDLKLPEQFLHSARCAVRLRRGRKKNYFSVDESCNIDRIFLLLDLLQQREFWSTKTQSVITDVEAGQRLPRGAFWLDLHDACEHTRSLKDHFLLNRRIESVSWLNDSVVAIAFGSQLGVGESFGPKYMNCCLAELPTSIVSFRTFVSGDSGYTMHVLNSLHDFVAWLVSISSNANPEVAHLQDKRQIIFNMLHDYKPTRKTRTTIGDINQFVRGFRAIPDLPKELHPPDITLTDDMFRIKPGDKLPPLPDGTAKK